MDKWQAQVQKSLLDSETDAINALRKSYETALKDVKKKLKDLQDADELTQAKIYQIGYQNALKGQLESILDGMAKSQADTIGDYLKSSYEDAYAGVMYDLQKQGIPVTMPIDQEQVTRAVLADSPLSETMYKELGKRLRPLKKAVAQEISRGIASNMAYADIARNIDKRASIGLSNAIRIARTEGHRVQQAATADAQEKAKATGADVVKQWDATLDGRTRKHHRQLDGQLRELDEPFEVGGRKAMRPGAFGRAEEDINCRCVLLQRARWALDDDELAALKERARFFGLDKTSDFEDYRAKYLKVAASADEKDPLRPAMVAGAKRGEPMTHERADSGHVNPKYREGGGYTINCQSCVVTYYARLRGYDVEVLPNTPGSMLERLSRATNLAWLDPKTGRIPEYITVEGVMEYERAQWLRGHLEEGAQYTFEFAWKGGRGGHIVTIKKDGGVVSIYDPQVDMTVSDADRKTDPDIVSEYEEALRTYGPDHVRTKRYKRRIDGGLYDESSLTRYLERLSPSCDAKLLRVDGLMFDPDVVDEIMKAVEK